MHALERRQAAYAGLSVGPRVRRETGQLWDIGLELALNWAKIIGPKKNAQ